MTAWMVAKSLQSTLSGPGSSGSWRQSRARRRCSRRRRPGSLHRFRVAMRRSRALIRASRPLLGHQLERLDAELRWLGGSPGRYAISTC